MHVRCTSLLPAVRDRPAKAKAASVGVLAWGGLSLAGDQLTPPRTPPVSFVTDPSFCSLPAIASIDRREKAGSRLCDRVCARSYLAIHLRKSSLKIRIG